MTHTPPRSSPAGLIQRLGRLDEENAEALARLVTREIGKPDPESLGEVTEIVDTTAFSAMAKVDLSDYVFHELAWHPESVRGDTHGLFAEEG